MHVQKIRQEYGQFISCNRWQSDWKSICSSLNLLDWSNRNSKFTANCSVELFPWAMYKLHHSMFVLSPYLLNSNVLCLIFLFGFSFIPTNKSSLRNSAGCDFWPYIQRIPSMNVCTKQRIKRHKTK